MKTPGQIIAANRAEAGLSLAKVAGPMGISVPYLHDIEHDRRQLPPSRWASIKAVLPRIDLRGLAVATVAAGTFRIEARLLTEEQRGVMVEALLSTVAS